MASTVWRLSGGDILGGTSRLVRALFLSLCGIISGSLSEPAGRPRFTVFTPLSHGLIHLLLETGKIRQNRMQQSEGEIDEEIPFRIQLV
ncbi:hypothetical protein PPACK8108_LOCUS22325 [Phakopsora pachyrhizi]|uniref:Secreted protein n=1 Tax=Phakopsora pachyrhizi TaxID=170000 RepID=A0AAV0BNE3_PHAPC|nr:hypothetical protein PPACK8108_LOCUS22325 [Phakopsora pachyrhizi]